MKYYSTSIIAAQEARQAISGLNVHEPMHFPATELHHVTQPTPKPRSIPPAVEPNRKKKKKKPQFEIGLMENPQEMLVGPDEEEFDIIDYMEVRRQKAKRINAKQTIAKKCKTRTNNIVHTEAKPLADALFETKCVSKNTPQPEPPRISPLLRYTPDDQKSLQKQMFINAKEFVSKTYPEKTGEDLEKAIFDEMNKRMKAWEDSH